MRRMLARACALVTLLLAPLDAEAAKLVSATGAQPGAYGRIVLTFDKPVALQAKLSGTILVLSFGETVASGPERIAAGMADFVGMVRRDPDGSALRLALRQPYRLNVQNAGEQVFVDLLPAAWTGLPPALPPETIAELARRAREAEAALRVKNPPPVVRTLPLELARTASRTRLSLKLPQEARSLFEEAGPGTRLSLPGAWRIDEQPVRGRLTPEIGTIAIANEADGARLAAVPAAGVELVAERDGDTVTIDFLPRKAAEAKSGEAKHAEAKHTEVKHTEANRPEVKPGETHAVEPADTRAADAAGGGEARSEPPAPAERRNVAGSVAPVSREPSAEEAAPRRAGSGLVFPFRKRVPAALFARGGVATLVFETDEPVAVPHKEGSDLVPLGEPQRVGAFSVLRFTVPTGRLVDLLPVAEPRGWELAVGEGLAPGDSLVAERRAGENVRAGIGLALPEPGAAVWLDLDGERIAVVTTSGAKRAGIAKPQRFVDFELLSSRLGVAVLALADDLAVRPGLDGVTIEREGAMALSAVTRAPEPPVGAVGELVIDERAWEAARGPGVRDRLRAAFGTAAGASRGDRGPARLALAKVMLANGLNVEASGALAAAASEDPVLEGEPQTTLLRGILAARMGRSAEAEKLLSAETLARNPEARLWRGVVRAAAGQWSAGYADLRGGQAVLDRYPEDVATPIQIAIAEAAAELSDWDATASAIKSVHHVGDALSRDRLALLKARLDEGKRGTGAALDAYASLSERAELPVAAAAALRSALLLHASGTLALPETIDRLERLTLFWHGGGTEIETRTALGRLYGEAGRWRQAFATVRQADALAPDAPQIRTLHEAAQAVFEDLFLGERAERIGGIEALALYFDFKDFAPVGRRADEIVRRLADRLVGLDLLDSAGELLQHQIDHRLTGPARAGVAARLATIRLMEGKPHEALQSLDATHLPELAPDLRRARALLRARALSDLSRTELALETIEGESGSDAERLRADILWGARRWREAGEAHEALLGEIWRQRKPLDDAARADVIRAGIAYGLAGEALGLERLKAKFAPAMADSADARTFALLTQANATRNPAFREIARKATTSETLAAFLAEYRKRYPTEAVPERGKPETRAEGAAAAPG